MSDWTAHAAELARTIAAVGVRDRRWLAAVEQVPRHLFVPRWYERSRTGWVAAGIAAPGGPDADPPPAGPRSATVGPAVVDPPAPATDPTAAATVAADPAAADPAADPAAATDPAAPDPTAASATELGHDAASAADAVTDPGVRPGPCSDAAADPIKQFACS